MKTPKIKTYEFWSKLLGEKVTVKAVSKSQALFYISQKIQGKIGYYDGNLSYHTVKIQRKKVNK